MSHSKQNREKSTPKPKPKPKSAVNCKTPFARYNRLSIRFTTDCQTGFYNRLHLVNKHSIGCSTGLRASCKQGLRTAHVCIYCVYCSTHHRTEQFWQCSLLSSRQSTLFGCRLLEVTARVAVYMSIDNCSNALHSIHCLYKTIPVCCV